MVLQLVLPGEALVAVIPWAGVGPLPRVEELVPRHMLGSGKFLSTDITGVFVVHFRAEILIVRHLNFEEIIIFTCAFSHAG